jgi:type II secretory ATPase GspE/PulE/Tfp pilus assembly ATPase PilB-like protein
MNMASNELAKELEREWDLATFVDLIPMPLSIHDDVYFDEPGTLLVTELTSKKLDFIVWLDQLRYAGMKAELAVITAEDMDQKKSVFLNNTTDNEAQLNSLVQAKAINIMNQAALLGASDIHIQTKSQHADIEYRVNGDLIRQDPISIDDAYTILPSIMNTMTGDGINMYNHLERQDTRISNDRFLPKSCTSIRIASGPLADDGRYMVLRLLYKDTQTVKGSLEDRLKNLGYTSWQIEEIDLAWDKPSGVNIIAGPTGSGKSTTLKHILEAKKAQSPDENFLSVEDPPEYNIGGVRQIPVNNAKGSTKRGEAYADVIRFLLRANPDKMLVGEIRDKESLKAAIEAAQTGHGVSASLHANSCFGILQRTFDLMRSAEIPDPASIIADETIITGLIFQRLVKVNCSECSKDLIGEGKSYLRSKVLDRLKDVIPEDDWGSIKVSNPKGCKACNYTGVKGRTVIAEVVVTDAEMMERIRNQGIQAGKRYWRNILKGKTVFEHAFEKMKDGILSPDNAEKAVGPINTEILNERRYKLVEESTNGDMI